MAPHYQRPGWFTKHVFNPAVAGLTRLGVSLAGSRELEVRGRVSGEGGPGGGEGEGRGEAAEGETS